MVQITNANDVEIILQGEGDTKRGTTGEAGRIVVDEFSISKEEDDTLISGVGNRQSIGFTNGDITHGFDFTMMGDDLQTFDIVADSQGASKPFSMTARKTDDNGIVEWEFSLDPCKATSEEMSGSSGDATEYAVEGIAVSVSKKSDTNTSIWSA